MKILRTVGGFLFGYFIMGQLALMLLPISINVATGIGVIVGLGFAVLFWRDSK